jgi:hypothetical protein
MLSRVRPAGIGGAANSADIPNIEGSLRDRAEPGFAAAVAVEPASPPPTTAKKRAPQEADNEFIHTTRTTQRITSGRSSEVIAENRIKTRADRLPLPLVIPRMTPNPQYNPMQSVPLRERGMPKDKSEKGLLQNQNQRNAIAAIFKEYMKYMKGYVPFLGDGNFERSLVIGKDAVRDGDSENDENKAAREQTDFNKSNKLVRHLRGKTFRYVRGVWIDDQYDAEMSAWRLTWLKRGSEAYKRVLAEEPQLREFFDFGPIIVVWRDKIYRVTESEQTK